MLRVVVVEDEADSRGRLRRLLGAQPTPVELVGEADTGPLAVEMIVAERPDLAFMDIELPGFDGFEVVRQCSALQSVVFTTAHPELAVRTFNERAIKDRAVHYLVKPIDPEQLQEALARSQKQRAGLSRILCRDRDTTYVIRPADVLFLKADQGATLVCTSLKEHLSSDSLTTLELGLGDDFVRIHRNALVNVQQVECLKHQDGDTTVVLRNGMDLQVSRRHANQLRDRLLYGRSGSTRSPG